MKEVKLETRLVEVEQILHHNEGEGTFVLKCNHLIERKRRRAESDPYVRGRQGRYVIEIPFVLEGDILECEVEASYSKTVGKWFKVHSAARKAVSLVQIEKYLRKYIPEMTEDRLRQIIDKYGLDTFQAIQNDPNAFDFAGLLPEDSGELRDTLNEIAAYEELIVLLQANGVDCRFSYPLFQKYHATSPRVLRSPYTPYMDRIYDFRTADKLYLKQGNAPSDPTRCRFAVHALLEAEIDRQGNLFIRKDHLKEELRGFMQEDTLPFTDEALQASLESLAELGKIKIEMSLGGTDIYLRSIYELEQTAAENIERVWLGEKRAVTSQDNITAYLSHGNYSLSLEQKQAVLTGLTSPMTIISGGPGTGKTYTTKVIVDAISDLCPSAKIQLCAPTALAARRIADVTGMEATTIHSMLGLAPEIFQEPRVRPGELDCDYLIIDEFSMVDMALCRHLFVSAASRTRVIILGDHNQLPSVGPGLVLRDMMGADIFPVLTLSRVFRQDGESRIVKNAHSIFAPIGADRKLSFADPQKPGGDFYFLKKDDPRNILDEIQRVAEAAINENHLSLKSIAVLTPIHRSPLGIDHLNTMLQDKLNPSKKRIASYDREFRLHDKVIQTENDPALGVYNGEIGFVVEIEGTSRDALTVEYPGKTIKYPYSKLGKLDLAYAMTVHKMQGSECDLVIMPVYKNNLSKHILYTAFTRAKKAVVLIGTEEELRAGVQRETNQDRESNLLKRLQAQIQHVAFLSPEAEVPEELAGGDEQQALFTAVPALPVSKVTSPENVSKQGENQP